MCGDATAAAAASAKMSVSLGVFTTKLCTSKKAVSAADALCDLSTHQCLTDSMLTAAPHKLQTEIPKSASSTSSIDNMCLLSVHPGAF